jgi:hypothetical protein
MGAVLCALLFSATSFSAALAGDAPDPAPAVSPQPAATAAAVPPSPPPAQHRRLRIGVQSSLTYVNQQFVGPGIAPPEASAFASGQPIAPGTPYDLWTSSPTVTGYGVNHALLITPAYYLSPQYELGATLGYGSISGNGNVAAYWGDQTMATLNPHLGKRPAHVAFPAANSTEASPRMPAGSISRKARRSFSISRRKRTHRSPSPSRCPKESVTVR